MGTGNAITEDARAIRQHFLMGAISMVSRIVVSSIVVQVLLTEVSWAKGKGKMWWMIWVRWRVSAPVVGLGSCVVRRQVREGSAAW